MHKRYPAVVVCCAALAAAGCGSSHTGTTQATTRGPVSQGVFSTDLKALCQSARTASGGNLDKAAAALSEALPQFEAITPPPSHRVAYSRFLIHLRALADAIKHKDLGAAHTEADKLSTVARQMNVPACAL